jgi:hypothetical protein
MLKMKFEFIYLICNKNYKMKVNLVVKKIKYSIEIDIISSEYHTKDWRKTIFITWVNAKRYP